MICPTCGAEITEGARFCEACGSALESACSVEKDAQTASEPENEAITAGEMMADESAVEPVTVDMTAPVAEMAAPNDNVTAQESSPSPVFQMREPEKPFGVWRWIGVILLLQLPIVQVVMTIVWACSAKRQTLKNFARAIIICFLVSVIISVSAAIAMRAFQVNLFNLVFPRLLGFNN